MSKWKECKLGEVITLNYGKSLPVKKRNSGDIPVYSSAGLTGWHDKALIDSKGLIIGRKGTIGKVYKSETPFYAIDTSYYVLPNNDVYDFDFLFFLLGSIGLDELNEDSAVPGLNRNTAYSQEISLPPIPEQRAIASVLSSLDDKIDLLHRQNKTLEAMAETLFRQWFIEEAREDWEEVSLGDIATVQNGYAFSSQDYIEHQIDHLEVFKMGHIEPGGGLRYSPKTDFVPRAEKLKKWILSEGDIVMAMTDMKDSMGILGHPAMIDKSDTYVLNQRVARIYLNSNECLINNHFLYLQLKTDVAIAIIQSKAHGGVQVNLPTEAIRSIPIIVPLEPDQEKGFKLLEGYLLKSQNNRKQIRTLEKLRDTLLPKLMSGEVRVDYNGSP